jgi:4-alpha-glucanotransferase
MSGDAGRAGAFHPIAALLGIETSHIDALGVIHEPDAETLAALVAAFGLPAEPDLAAAAIADMRRAAPLGLDPLYVVAAEAPILALDLPQDLGPVEWRLELEEGGHTAGRWDPGEGKLQLPENIPLGYHRLELLGAGGDAATIGIAVAPPACYLPSDLQPSARSWGLTAQLYSLRSGRGWGMGDFTDLAQLTRAAGSLGAVTVGINPLHALFASEPRHSSPYSPSTRGQLDYLYIDPSAVPGFADDAAIRAQTPRAALAAVRASELVDHAAVAALKRPVLEALYRQFRDLNLNGGETAVGKQFRRFTQEGGWPLTVFATFEALHEHLTGNGGNFSWHGWPVELRDPNSAAVAEFADAHQDRVAFFQFLQWQADSQLGAAAEAGRAAGLSLGLYRDLAVGVNPEGAEAWGDQGIVVPGMGIGAPPDALSRAGQDWGLAPVNPLALRQRGFQPFIAALRANMRHAGVLRIDHVMSLQRLYWVPAGRSAMAGAYVRYPFAELLRLVALESHRQRCAVVGEDLGTVPSGFRETMQAANLLTYRVVMFERRWDGNFIPPRDYPPLAAASAATHDLATLKGFWLGRDIAWRQRLALYPDAASEAADISDRHTSRWQLLEALAREGLIPYHRFGEFLPQDAAPVYTMELGEAIFAFLARSPARLMLVQVEDIAGEEEQANLPGTSDAHPNWRRRLSAQLEEILDGAEMQRIAALVTEGRQRSVGEA